MMDTLYSLSQEYKNLLALAEDPDTEKALFMDTLEGFQAVLADKVDGYAVVFSELSARVDKIDKEIERLKGLKKACETSIDSMKEYAKTALVDCGEKEFKSDLHSIKLYKAGGKPSLILADTNDIPADYMKYEWVEKPDKEKIEEALKNGEELPFAHYAERSTYVKIQ